MSMCFKLIDDVDVRTIFTGLVRCFNTLRSHGLVIIRFLLMLEEDGIRMEVV